MAASEVGGGPGTVLNPAWSERYLEGSREREDDLLRLFADQIQMVQARNRKTESEPVRRGFHAKLLVGVVNARFTVAADVRSELSNGLFAPGASYPAMVRFSNASGTVNGDDEKDLRGVAVRILVTEDGPQDLLFTNTPSSYSRDARQFMVTAVATAGGRKLSALPRLIRHVGLPEGLRIARALRRGTSRRVISLATETFWSRVPFAVGPYAVKFRLQPLSLPPPGAEPRRGFDRLRLEFAERLGREDIRFALQVLHYVDDTTTPIEDATVEWTGASEAVGELLIPRQDVTRGDGPDGERMLENLSFSPWTSTEWMRPLGSLNRARKPVYEASVRLRSPAS